MSSLNVQLKRYADDQENRQRVFLLVLLRLCLVERENSKIRQQCGLRPRAKEPLFMYTLNQNVLSTFVDSKIRLLLMKCDRNVLRRRYARHW